MDFQLQLQAFIPIHSSFSLKKKSLKNVFLDFLSIICKVNFCYNELDKDITVSIFN